MSSLTVSTSKSTPPPGATNKSKAFVAAKDVAVLVSMPELLSTMGIQVNTHTRRAPCVLHSGTNVTAFSWTDDGRWHCFHCARGGDKFSLVQEVRKCSFLDALRFLAALAGVEWADLNTAEVRRQLAKAKKKAQRAKAATDKLHTLERTLLLDAREELLGLHCLRRNAGARLTAMARGAKPHFLGESELAWSALALVAGKELRTGARYTFLAFAAPADRMHFALNPRERERMVDEVLATGAVVDEKGRVMEIGAP